MKTAQTIKINGKIVHFPAQRGFNDMSSCVCSKAHVAPIFGDPYLESIEYYGTDEDGKRTAVTYRWQFLNGIVVNKEDYNFDPKYIVKDSVRIVG